MHADDDPRQAQRHDVAIVGAGPVGLTLALALARRGIDVVVLERQRSTAEHSRAPAIWPASQEVLDDLGVIDRFVAAGIARPTLRLWDADHDRPLLKLPLHELRGRTRHAQLLVLPQSTTERLLCEAVRRAGAAVRFDHQVVGVAQDDGGVQLRVRQGDGDATVQARFAVGCDGAHSRVRDSIGGTLDGMTYRTRAVLADVRLGDEGADSDAWPFPRLTTRGGVAIGIRIDHDLWRLILPIGDDEADAGGDSTADAAGADEEDKADAERTGQRVAHAVHSLFPRLPAERGVSTVWRSRFRLHRRVSTRWFDGRVGLAGDAAHLNSPVGGEGMNAGIADAAALAPALAQALLEDSPRPVHDCLRTRRQTIDRGVNRFTDRLTRVLLAGDGRFIRPVLRTAGLALTLRPLRHRLMKRLAMLEP